MIRERIKAFIQNVHNFRDDALVDERPPIEHVVIFDEAQRAWNLRQTANFMQRKKGRAGFSQSEPEFLISYMDRHKDWAVIVCLVGGGQEINIGEAGIDAWLDAVNTSFPEWDMYISSRLTDTEYAADLALKTVQQRQSTSLDDSLHLSVSMRSFRAENVSAFVKALLDCDKDNAQETLAKCLGRYPMAVTRNLDRAKEWIREHARGTERFGMVASSKAQRLKPHAIDIRVPVDPVHWFLNDKRDTRSSFYLEDAATEFQVQGLELDWACVNWDGDLRFTGSNWSFHDFRGDRWTNIKNVDNTIIFETRIASFLPALVREWSYSFRRAMLSIRHVRQIITILPFAIWQNSASLCSPHRSRGSTNEKVKGEKFAHSHLPSVLS